MKFADFVCFEAVIPELESKDRDGAITELVAALDKAGRLGKGNCDKITRAVIKRENEASTGMGKGIGVPHVKHKSVKDVVAAAPWPLSFAIPSSATPSPARPSDAS